MKIVSPGHESGPSARGAVPHITDRLPWCVRAEEALGSPAQGQSLDHRNLPCKHQSQNDILKLHLLKAHYI
ncbi:hypothetical protein Y1Q_0015663 [Alligator mississippiensis]|uniref:Uncharacterized protein n=1 Tax=Alligator mississippiensis TaxID=8496 RepID=A0A151NNQ0_ALLMI|nr:hypothetical protein Y1Q_0015663 [Alligator mississippiensis]